MTVKSPASSPASVGVAGAESDFLGDGAGCCAATRLIVTIRTSTNPNMRSEISCLVLMDPTPHQVQNLQNKFQRLTEKYRARSRPVDLDMTIRAVSVLRIHVVL